jgi:hypothetical protein
VGRHNSWSGRNIQPPSSVQGASRRPTKLLGREPSTAGWGFLFLFGARSLRARSACAITWTRWTRPGAQAGTRRSRLSLIVPRIVLLVVPKTSTTVWVLILLFGTPTATTTLLTTLATFLTTFLLTTLATLTSLLAALILTLILRHHYLPIGIFPRIQLRRSLTCSTCCPIVTQSYRVSHRGDVEARRSRWPCRRGRSAMKLLRPASRAAAAGSLSVRIMRSRLRRRQGQE